MTARLTDVAAGGIPVHVAPAKKVMGRVSARVTARETGWRAELGLGWQTSCTIHWGAPGTPAGPAWSDCRIEVPHPLASVEVDVERDGGEDAELMVADLLIGGDLLSPRPSVFVLLVDATRFDLLRPFAAGSPFGEQLEDLAHDSVVFRELRSTTSWTRPAVATLFTGQRPDRHRVDDRGDKLAVDAVTVPELLQRAGYATYAWSANANVLPLWGFGQGFDAFVDEGSRQWATAKSDGAGLLDRLQAALAVRGPEAGFYYVHLMDPHGPYLPSKDQRSIVDELPDVVQLFPRPLAALTRPEDWKAFRDYLGELLDLDDHIGRFVRLLRENGLYEDSLVLVVADHGEEFLDHGGRDHGRTLYEEVLRVPALLKLPGNAHGGSTYTRPASFEDLAPTVLDALGVDVPPGIDGRVLSMTTDGQVPARPHLATLRLDGRRQRAIVDPPWKLIQDEPTGRLELYNLADDPKESRNVASVEQEVLGRLKATLHAALDQTQPGWHVLVCGTLEEQRLDFVVHASAERSTFHGFEASEVVPIQPEVSGANPDRWRLRPVLAPVRIQKELLVRGNDLLIPRRPEMILEPGRGQLPSTLEVSTTRGKLRFRLGSAGTIQKARRVRLRTTQPAVLVDAGARVECGETGPADPSGRPHLRIFYVAPAESLPDEELDPELRERLRALGYLD